MSITFSPRACMPLRISPPPSYSSLPPIISPPDLIHCPIQNHAGINAITEKTTESQRLLGILLDKSKYEETAPSLPRHPCPVWEGGADVFSFPSLTRPISRLLGKDSANRYTSADGPCGARVLASPLNVSSPRTSKQKYNRSCLAIPVPSLTISQDVPSSHALVFDLHTPSITSMSSIGPTFPHPFSSFATVPIPLSPSSEALPSIPDSPISGMTLHAPVPSRRVSRGAPRLSPLERGAREMLGGSAPETQEPSPQEHSVSLYQRAGSNPSSASPPQSRFSARLRRLAPPALQLVPTPTEFSSPDPSGSISGLRILQGPSTRQGTLTIGLGINVPKIIQPEIVQRAPSPDPPLQVTHRQAPEFEEVEDPQSPSFGSSPDSPPLDYMDIGSPRTPPNLPRHTLLSLPTVTPALSQGAHYDFIPFFDPVQGQQQDREEDVPMLPAYTEVVEADRIQSQLEPQYLDEPIAGPSRLPALDLLFVARSDTGDLLGRVGRCVDAVQPIGLSLGACSYIPGELLYPLCDSLRIALTNIGNALRSRPTGFDVDTQELGEQWYSKYRNVLASLERNVNLFYLLAEQISRRPPRSHRLDSHMSKLHQYVKKFDDLHRRLLYFHDRVDILKLRSKLNASKRRAQEQKQAERERRRIFNSAFEEGRTRRHELRDELREVYRTRASRFPSGAGRDNPPPGWF